MRPAPDFVASVVVPCHNSADTLAETVASIAAQTLAGIETILVDDGSTDATVDLMHALAAASPETAPVRVLKRPQRGGVAAARNTGIAAARGRYVLPLDADDLIAPAFLEQACALLDAHPQDSIVTVDRQDFGDLERRWPAGPFELERLKYFNQVAYASLYRRSLWTEVGGYRTNVEGLDDWDFWIAAALRGATAIHLPHAYLLHRRRRSSYLWRLLDRYETLHARIILNNPAAYAAGETAAARAFLAHGTPSSLLRSAKFVFMSRYYAEYATAAPASA